MAQNQPSDGRRDLALIRASGSTARVLNLALVFERFGASEEFAANPLFKSQRLNRALIIKHTLRDHERSLFERPEPHTTKIIFPYSPTELGLGGTSVLIGEKRFEQLFRKAVGASVNAADYDSDFDLLCLLHDLPSFDPFLMREQLRRANRQPAKCFFDISEADIAAMLNFVAAEIEPLTSLAFGAAGRRAENMSMRLAEKLMTDENAQLLMPLRDTLRLSHAEYLDGVFAWKGFLYYKWLLGSVLEGQAPFGESFVSFGVTGGERPARAEISSLRESVLSRLDLIVLRVGEVMDEYAEALMALIDGRPLPFRQFLLNAPAKFISLGEAMGVLKHVHSFWGFRFPEKVAPRFEADEALEVLQEFDRMLSGLDLIGACATRDMVLA